MRKYIALSTLLAYAGIFNYCLVYAAVAGEGHHAATASSAEPGGRGAHGHDREHEGSSHDHAPSGETDACCTNLTEGLPVLPVSARAVLRPAASAPFVALALDAPFHIASPDRRFIARAQGPPGPPGRSAFLQPSSPRAPPVLPGF